MLYKILKVSSCPNLHVAKYKIQEEEFVYLPFLRNGNSSVSWKQFIPDFVPSFLSVFTDLILMV